MPIGPNPHNDLTLAQASPLLKVTAERLRDLIKTHRFDGIKVGRRWYVGREDVARAMLDGLPKTLPQRHDRTYRHLFSHPEVIHDLLVGFFDSSWVGELDFSTLSKVSEAFVTNPVMARWADMVWKVKWRDHELHVCLLLEFQHKLEPYMAVRWMPILGGFYQDQLRQMVDKDTPFPPLMTPPNPDAQTPAERLARLPLVIPIVIYNGKSPWWPSKESENLFAVPQGFEWLIPIRVSYKVLDIGRVPEGKLRDLGENLVAALVRLETSPSRQDLYGEVESLRGWLPERFHESFELWLRATLGGQELELPEEARIWTGSDTMLAESLREWKVGYLEEGRKEGRAKGQAELVVRLARQRFGRVDDATRRRIEAADEEALLRCADRILTARKLSDLF